MTPLSPGRVLSTILKHDTKVTSYKIALLRAINDSVLSFPDVYSYRHDVAIPLRILAQFWIAYYWPFVEQNKPILQGPRAVRRGVLTSDISFRSQLTALRTQWTQVVGGVSHASDGFFLINELRLPRRRQSYHASLIAGYDQTLRVISTALEQPIRYAGPGQWTVFDRPARYDRLQRQVTAIPGTRTDDVCMVISSELWRTFRSMSLWIEALCLHEWCLFTETVQQEGGRTADRGEIYRLLTARPDNRRPLTWERNSVDLLLMEGRNFTCPWTERHISHGIQYDLDHLIPISIYPINELWNLVPSDPYFNAHVKRDRLPSLSRLKRAKPHIVLAYEHYSLSGRLAQAIREDVSVRFSTVHDDLAFPVAVADVVMEFIRQVSESRNLARFD